MSWQPVEHFPHLEVLKTLYEGEGGQDEREPDGRLYRYELRRVGTEGVHIVVGYENYIQLLADMSASGRYLPVGDAVHSALDFLGFERCLPCAERQAKLNRLIKKPGKV